MSSSDEHDIALSPKPLEIKLADVLFLAMRRHLMVFKDLTGPRYLHYTMVMRGSLIDFHKTLEDQGRHVQILKVEFDWQFFMRTMMQQIRANLASLLKIAKCNDPEWEDLEVEVIPVKALMEFLSPLTKGARWNVDIEFLEKLEKTVSSARLGELADHGIIIGTAEGYLVFGNGADFFLFNMDKMIKIIEKSFELSIREIHLSRFSFRLILFYFKVRLMKFVHSRANYLRRL